jgi:hypothetical protein
MHRAWMEMVGERCDRSTRTTYIRRLVSLVDRALVRFIPRKPVPFLSLANLCLQKSSYPTKSAELNESKVLHFVATSWPNRVTTSTVDVSLDNNQTNLTILSENPEPHDRTICRQCQCELTLNLAVVWRVSVAASCAVIASSTSE